jgi:FlaA1/EpsC-like NDP-sugar epimerase
MLKMFKYEDLLGSERCKSSNKIPKNSYNNKTILITGAAGFIGSEIARLISLLECKRLILVDKAASELRNLQEHFKSDNIKNIDFVVSDITSRLEIQKIFNKYRPQIVFHTAANKYIHLMEKSPLEAVKTNVLGTKIMADTALHYEVEKFIFISTDKAVNPSSVMGATKRIGEKYLYCLGKSGKTKFITVRFGNVLGSSGSVVPIFESQIKKGEPITVTHKAMTRYFLTLDEARHLVLETSIVGKGGRIYVFEMGKPIKIYDLALKMIRLSGLRYPQDITINLTGIRPGEKLHEELFSKNEQVTTTANKKIKAVRITDLNCNDMLKKVNNLCHLEQTDNFKLVSQLKDILPEYIPKNSVFEVLDDRATKV